MSKRVAEGVHEVFVNTQALDRFSKTPGGRWSKSKCRVQAADDSNQSERQDRLTILIRNDCHFSSSRESQNISNKVTSKGNACRIAIFPLRVNQSGAMMMVNYRKKKISIIDFV